VWQKLYAELKDRDFMVVAVAEDGRGAEGARPWIEQARPEYWALIDPTHRVASLYGMANVPRAVWIDATDHFRRMDAGSIPSPGTCAE